MAYDYDHELERLEQLWLLPSDVTPLERLLGSLTGAGQRHRTMLLRRMGRERGLNPYLGIFEP